MKNTAGRKIRPISVLLSFVVIPGPDCVFVDVYAMRSFVMFVDNWKCGENQ
jgi:hypothetical protein